MSFVYSKHDLFQNAFKHSETFENNLNNILEAVASIDSSDRPKNIKEYESYYCSHIQTQLGEGCYELISDTFHRWNIEKVSQGEPRLWFKNKSLGEYAMIYRHPKDGRFCAIPAKRAFKWLLERWKNSEYHHNLLSGLMDFFLKGEYTLFHKEFYTREVQESIGVYIKVGKVCRHLVDCDNADRLSVFAGFVQDAMNEADAELERVKVSDNIAEVYTKRSDFHSCMRNMPEETFEIYQDFGCKIAYIEEDGMLLARALLHDKVIEPFNNRIYRLMDTIYGHSKEEAILKKWAKAHGYSHKVTQSYSQSEFTNGSEKFYLSNTAYIEALDPEFEFYAHMYKHVPFIDTFYGFEEGGNKLYHNAWTNSGECRNTNGSDRYSYLGESILLCCCCNTSVDEDDCYYDSSGEVYCEECYHERFRYCEKCGEYYIAEEVHETDDGEWYCIDCLQRMGYGQCEECDTYTQDFVIINEDTCVCSSCLERNHPDAEQCEDCGEYWDAKEMEDFTDDDECDHSLCPNCFDKNWFKCECCGEIRPRDERVLVNRGPYWRKTICQECLDTENRGHYTCTTCGENFTVQDVPMHTVGHERICDTCWQKEMEASRKEEAIMVNHK